jgi:hypothetical protein
MGEAGRDVLYVPESQSWAIGCFGKQQKNMGINSDTQSLVGHFLFAALFSADGCS